jgi:two-component system, NarL family, nitrate/nitrite response regulator NarL
MASEECASTGARSHASHRSQCGRLSIRFVFSQRELKRPIRGRPNPRPRRCNVGDFRFRVNWTEVPRPSRLVLDASRLAKTLGPLRAAYLQPHSPSMKVLIVDDHPVFREGLAALLRQSGLDALVLQAGDVAEAFAFVAQHDDLDIVILDIVLPGMNGLPAVAEFGRLRPQLPIIVLSSSENPQDARRALAQGALGYVPKSANPQTLLGAIRLVLNGDLYVPPLILDETTAVRLAHLGRSAGAGGLTLTDRQIDVLRQLVEGRSNKVIAFDLGLSEKTVKAHVTGIFKSLNVVSRTQAAAVAREIGII